MISPAFGVETALQENLSIYLSIHLSVQEGTVVHTHAHALPRASPDCTSSMIISECCNMRNASAIWQSIKESARPFLSGLDLNSKCVMVVVISAFGFSRSFVDAKIETPRRKSLSSSSEPLQLEDYGCPNCGLGWLRETREGSLEQRHDGLSDHCDDCLLGQSCPEGGTLGWSSVANRFGRGHSLLMSLQTS